MGVLSRIGIALDSDLLTQFDESIANRGYTNRSEAFRDLIRGSLVLEQTSAPDATVVGTVTLIYDHHESNITEKLTEVQHANHVTMKKRRVMRNRPTGRRGRIMVWKASNRTKARRMLPAISAVKCIKFTVKGRGQFA